MRSISIKADSLSKYYPILRKTDEKIRHLALAILGKENDISGARTYVKALDNVSFQMRQGERVGIIGRNGAGKTTLLNLLSRNLEISRGKLEVHGNIYNLAAGQVGFDGNLSGRENAKAHFIRNSLLPDEVESKIAEIEDFVELSSYFDQPVKYYSLGMQMRAEFAVATAISSDIIMIDELLGSGDPYWVEKCASRLRALCNMGSTVLIVSHSLDQIMRYCDRTLWIDNGKLIMDGETKEVVRHYETFLEQLSWMSNDIDDSSVTLLKTLSNFDRRLEHPDCQLEVLRFPGREDVKFYGIWINEEKSNYVQIKRNEPIKFRISIIANTSNNYCLKYLITFWLSNGKRAAIFENEIHHIYLNKGESHEIIALMHSNILASDRYLISFSLFDLKENQRTSDERNSRLDSLWKSFEITIEEDFFNQNQIKGLHHATITSASVQ